MKSLSPKIGDLITLREGVTGIVVNIWKFDEVGTLVAAMVDGEVKVFPIHEITKVVKLES